MEETQLGCHTPSRLCLMAGPPNRVTADVYNRFIRKSPLTPILICAEPNLPYFETDLEGALAGTIKSAIRLRVGMGVTHVMIACNTMHDRRSEFMSKTGLFMYDMVGATRDFAAARYRKVGVLGTKTTMKQGLYKDARYDLIIPTLSQQDDVQHAIMEGMKHIDPHPDSVIPVVVQALIDRGAECVVLGCTDIPTMMEGFPNIRCEVPILDPIDVLIDMVMKDF